MKYILRGNDIPVTWNLKDYSTWEPISVPQSSSSFYVYSNDLRVKIDNFTITDSVLTSTIAGNLLPSGKYTLELIWNNNGRGRTVYTGAFGVVENGEDADKVEV